MAFITPDQVARALARRMIIEKMVEERILFLDDYLSLIEEAVTELMKAEDFSEEALIYANEWNRLEMEQQRNRKGTHNVLP